MPGGVWVIIISSKIVSSWPCGAFGESRAGFQWSHAWIQEELPALPSSAWCGSLRSTGGAGEPEQQTQQRQRRNSEPS